MTLITGLIVYFLIWWTVLFAVLPWGVRHGPTRPEEGIQAAPKNPNLGKKFIATTVVSGLIWLIIYAVIESEIISFRNMVVNWS